MAEDGPVEIGERHAHVADRAHPAKVRLVWVELEDAVRVVDDPEVLLRHHLAGCAVDGALVVLDPLSPSQKASARSRRSTGKYSVTQAPRVPSARARFSTSA